MGRAEVERPAVILAERQPFRKVYRLSLRGDLRGRAVAFLQKIEVQVAKWILCLLRSESVYVYDIMFELLYSLIRISTIRHTTFTIPLLHLIKEAYQAYQGKTPYRDDMREDFVFNGIHFVEYEGSASNGKGSVLRFIPDNQAIFIPMGTMNVFETVFAPADYVEAVNTIGVPYYAKQKLQDFDKGVDIQTQSNPLTICKRPDLLVKATLS